MYKVIEFSNYYEDTCTDVNFRISVDDVTFIVGGIDRTISWEEFEQLRKDMAKVSRERKNV